MKIYSIMLVKDEADIVRSVLEDASRWSDKIFVLDNGSIDGTWEIIQSMKNEVIVPWKQYFGPYHNGLRADVFKEFSRYSEYSDINNAGRGGVWWCFKLDADEFYYDNPREFLAKVPKKYSLVAKKSLDYVITEEDVSEYEFTGDFERDKNHIRCLNKDCWSEPRFFRFRKGLEWKNAPENHYPPHAGLLCPDYILVKHYQYRSPAQMQKRLDIRNASEAKKQGIAFRHVRQAEWRELLEKRSNCVYDDGSADTYKALPVRNRLMPPLYKRLAMSFLLKTGVWR